MEGARRATGISAAGMPFNPPPSCLVFKTLFQPITIPVAIDNVGLMGQSIQQGSSHNRVAKHLRPVGETKVGRDHNGTSFVSFRHDLKKQLPSYFGKRYISEFIQDE